MRHGAEDLVLEAIGALQAQPLRRQPAVGLHQRAGTLRHAVLELGIGGVQLLVQDHIVEGDRQPAAEDLDQRTVGFRQLPLGLQQHHDLATGAGADVEHGALVGEIMLAAAEGVLDHQPQIGIERLRRRAADEAAVAARSRQHGKIVADVAAVAQHQDPGTIDIEQGRDLRQYALGEPLHRAEII